MPIISITAAATSSTAGTKTTLHASLAATQQQLMYVFGDTTIRLFRAGSNPSDWIPVGGSVSPRPMLVGRGAKASEYEVTASAASVDYKIIITDEPFTA